MCTLAIRYRYIDWCLIRFSKASHQISSFYLRLLESSASLTVLHCNSLRLLVFHSLFLYIPPMSYQCYCFIIAATTMAWCRDMLEGVHHKHCALNVQPEAYNVVGENIIGTIVEMLNLPIKEMIELQTQWGDR